jgi:hypothetical protein
MSEEHRESVKTQLALALAKGECIDKWAKANGVSRATAYEWADERAVRKAVAAHRRRALEQAVGLMSEHAEWAAKQMVHIAKHGRSDSVRLSALRALRATTPAPSIRVGMTKRVAAIEKRLGNRAQKMRGTAADPKAAVHGLEGEAVRVFPGDVTSENDAP